MATYKKGTITAITKTKTQCQSVVKFLKTKHVKSYFKDDLFGLDDDDAFDEIFVVLHYLPDLELVTCENDDGNIFHIPLIFIRNFVEW